MNEWAEKIGEWGKRKGWHNDSMDPHAIATKLLLVASELTEAFEEIRDGGTPTEVYDRIDKPEGFPIEIADAVIRILHLCYELGIDIDKMVELKMAYNETRSYRHGGKTA
jgi:NTP pyrophosphatase (non-canonical NTP hydrolase)